MSVGAAKSRDKLDLPRRGGKKKAAYSAALPESSNGHRTHILGALVNSVIIIAYEDRPSIGQLLTRKFGFALVLALGTACSSDTSGPENRTSIAVNGGNAQYGTQSGALAEPLQVIVTDPVSKEPKANVTVTWRVANGAGATITPTSQTGDDGIATATARLGPNLGAYTFEASAENLVGSVASFSATAVLAPTITSITPTSVRTGDTITIAGTNFLAAGDQNTVLFGGIRGRVLSSTVTSLRVVVPACLPTRTLPVTVTLGAVASGSVSLPVSGTTASNIQMTRGEVRVFSDPAALDCQRFNAQFGTLYMVMPQNYSEVVGSFTFFDLIGVLGGPTITSIALGSGASLSPDFASDWEYRLRLREQQFTGGIAKPELPANFRVQAPEIGDRKSFNVYDKNEKFVKITAEVMHISTHAVIYQDVNAPANGFTTADFQALGAAFDSPTYETDVAVFGNPSDIDNNGKINILLTPVVNELTPRGASGFVAGFFFGCDLQTARQCSGSNLSETFYLFVPDPTGKHGDTRTRAFVMNGVVPVLAHEFQHMINFAARQNVDALWLSEGLAHMAEDRVADAYLAAGNTAMAQLHRVQNYARGALYLRDSTSVSLLAEGLFGTLQMRGGAWLLLKYLSGHYGGDGLLRKMTQTTLSSVQNVTTAVGQPWSKLMAEWGVAIYADDAPDLFGASVRPEYTFPNLNLRTALGGSGAYPLSPRTVGTTDFVASGTLKASSQRHFLLSVPVGATINLAVTGQRGGPFATNAQPQVAIMRVR